MLLSFLTAGVVFIGLLLMIVILLQEGKGDMGLGFASRQMLFGGSGGQNFLETASWTLGFIFIFGCLGLTVLRTRDQQRSLLATYAAATLMDEGPLASATPHETNQPAQTVAVAESTQQTVASEVEPQAL